MYGDGGSNPSMDNLYGAIVLFFEACAVLLSSFHVTSMWTIPNIVDASALAPQVFL
jgi:hypothetical protein